MYRYSHTELIEKGYKPFKVTKKEYNQLFPNRKYRIWDKYKYYYNEEMVIMRRFINWKGVLFSTLTLPIAILINGIASSKEVWEEVKELYNQEKSRSFDSDYIPGETTLFQEIEKIVQEGLQL